MSFTKFALDTFISEKIMMITECNLKDMNIDFPNSQKWVSGFGLMVMFQNQPPEDKRHLALQFLRRAEMAFSEYERARISLLDHIKGAPRWSPYFQALYHIELTIALLYQVAECSTEELKIPLFEKKDGSSIDRIRLINIATKHHLAVDEQTVWLTNKGVKSKKSSVSYVELEALLNEYGSIANIMTDLNKLNEYIQNNA
jgi:hypothetical protein